MPTFRIKAEFDLTFSDEEAATAIARQRMIDTVDRAVLEGGRVETGTDTPVEQIDNMVQNPLVVSSLLATEVLARGAAQVPFAELANFKVGHVQA